MEIKTLDDVRYVIRLNAGCDDPERGAHPLANRGLLLVHILTLPFVEHKTPQVRNYRDKNQPVDFWHSVYYTSDLFFAEVFETFEDAHVYHKFLREMSPLRGCYWQSSIVTMPQRDIFKAKLRGPREVSSEEADIFHSNTSLNRYMNAMNAQ